MADYNQNMNGGSGVVEVSTNSIALFAADSTMLRIGFRGDMMFFTIIPKVADPNGGKPRWPKELGHTASFRPQTALALYDGFQKKILPDIAAGVDHPGYCVVPLNREASNLCGFSWAGGHACFTIFNGVREDRTCGDQYTFMFDPVTLIDTYNPNTGTYTVVESQAQLYVIIEALRMFGMCSTGSIGHSVKNATSWNSDMIQSHLRSIATKLGATPGEYGRYRGYNGNGGNYGNAPFAMDAPAAQPIGSSNYNQTPLAVPAAIGANDTVAWGNAIQDSGNIGPGVPDVHQVSNLESLMA